jgi:cell division protein FtsA
MERTESAVREAVEQAERIAGISVEQVYVGFSRAAWSAASPVSSWRLAGAGSSRRDFDQLLTSASRAWMRAGG